MTWLLIALITMGSLSIGECVTPWMIWEYSVNERSITMCSEHFVSLPPMEQRYHLFHELWHRFFFEVMTQQERDNYDYWRHLHLFMWDAEYITSYAWTNHVEDFAENFAIITYNEVYGWIKPFLQPNANHRYNLVLDSIYTYEQKRRVQTANGR